MYLSCRNSGRFETASDSEGIELDTKDAINAVEDVPEDELHHAADEIVTKHVEKIKQIVLETLPHLTHVDCSARLSSIR